MVICFLYARGRGDILWDHPWHAGGWVGGVPHSLSGAYLQNYSSYGHEISWVDRSHEGGVAVHRNHNFCLLNF